MQLTTILPLIIVFLLLIACAACVSSMTRSHKPRPPPSSSIRRSRGARSLTRTTVQQRSWQPSQHQITVVVCSCGKWNPSTEQTCWHCEGTLDATPVTTRSFTFKTAQRCAVCSFFVYPGESIALCPACQAQGHRTHMMEYIKAKGICPVCEQRINPRHLLRTTPLIQQAPQTHKSMARFESEEESAW